MTPAVTWFELGQKIAESHARHASNSVTLIPIVVEDLHAARPILNALAQIHDGCFLDASDQNADMRQNLNVYEPVPGTNDHVRREAISTSLSRSVNTVKIVDEGDDLLDVTFQDSRNAVNLSAGDRTLHAIGRAAAHKYLDEFPFAVIAYKSGTLDKRSRKAAWDLMVRHINGAPRKTPQTLVVAVESAIDVDMHCETEFGFRFAIEQGHLLYRQGAGHLRLAAKQIVEQSKTSPIVFFLGAGFSVSSHIPLGDQLRDNAILRILDNAQFEGLDSTDLGMLFHDLLSAMHGNTEWLSKAERSMNSKIFASYLTLERVLAVEKRLYPNLPTLIEFKERHDKVIKTPGPSAQILAKILQNDSAKIIVVQLNIDCLVERCMQAGMKIFASNEQFQGASEYISRYCDGIEQEIPLLKLHGTIESIDTCVVTQDQTDSGVCDAQFQTLTTLLEISENRLPWIYIGVSMRDRDLLQVLNGQQFARQLDERWVAPYIVPSVRIFGEHREPHWEGTKFEALEDRVITETSDAFFEALYTAWTLDRAP